MMYQGKLFVIAAPSGAGKTSLVNALINEMSDVELSISYTTRPKRPNEKDTVNYFFIDKQQFTQMIDQEAFLEYADVFGNQYGTARKPVNDALNQGKDVILEIDWQGAQQIKQKMPEAITIFIFPPSKATLLERLKTRAQDDEHVIQARMNKAVAEMSHYQEFEYWVMNDDFDTALNDLKSIVRHFHLQNGNHPQISEALIMQLLEKN